MTVSVPYTELTNNALTRPYGRDTYRIIEQTFVAYYEDTERALMQLQQVAVNHEAVLADTAPTARIVEPGENAITLELRSGSTTRPTPTSSACARTSGVP